MTIIIIKWDLELNEGVLIFLFDNPLLITFDNCSLDETPTCVKLSIINILFLCSIKFKFLLSISIKSLTCSLYISIIETSILNSSLFPSA